MAMMGVLLAVLFTLLLAHPAMGMEIHGFAEGAAGIRLGDEKVEKEDYNLLEGRLQLRYSYLPEEGILAERGFEFFIKTEAIGDGYEEDGHLVIREAYAFLRPTEWMDLKVGRQVLTWGTGDYLFVNDLFPKDYVSFFTGRDDEYLKLPSDALKLSLFTDPMDLDLVIIPFFEPDETVKGQRLSFFDPFEGRIVGTESQRKIIEQVDSLENTEVALRLYRNIGSFELALYGFRGFYKEPRGTKDEAKKEVYYPRLNVYGASLRGPFAGGIGSVEIGYYDSREDRKGRNRLVENPYIRYLFGYERDLGGDLKGEVQYLLEEMIHYDAYRGSLRDGDVERDRFRHLLTFKVTKLLKEQTLEVSFFAFYSPSDEDLYLRPRVSYSITDRWKVSVGGNIFWGRKDYTEFGQLDGNDNIYTRIRYSF